MKEIRNIWVILIAVVLVIAIVLLVWYALGIIGGTVETVSY